MGLSEIIFIACLLILIKLKTIEIFWPNRCDPMITFIAQLLLLKQNFKFSVNSSLLFFMVNQKHRTFHGSSSSISFLWLMCQKAVLQLGSVIYRSRVKTLDPQASHEDPFLSQVSNKVFEFGEGRIHFTVFSLSHLWREAFIDSFFISTNI